MRILLLAAMTASLLAMPARSQDAPTSARPEPGAEPGGAPPTPAANLATLQPCTARAARYEGPKGFGVVVTRLGRASVANPLRPLTPEVTEVLQVVIGGKLATAYGPDLTALRRGPAPTALEAQLGAPIRWEAALAALPDPLEIVAEDGSPLAALAFRACVDPPAVKAPPAAAAKGNGKPGPRKAAAPKAPPGFHVPQGAIAE